MKQSKSHTSGNPSLDKRQGLDDRELNENAAANQRARERAATDWEHAASHRKDDERGEAEKKRRVSKTGTGEFPPGVGSQDLHDPGSRDPDARLTINRS